MITDKTDKTIQVNLLNISKLLLMLEIDQDNESQNTDTEQYYKNHNSDDYLKEFFEEANYTQQQISEDEYQNQSNPETDEFFPETRLVNEAGRVRWRS